jgi:hypothetical protein
MLAAVRYADAVSSRRDGPLDPELRVANDGKRRRSWPPCSDGAGMKQFHARAREFDTSPGIAATHAGEIKIEDLRIWLGGIEEVRMRCVGKTDA